MECKNCDYYNSYKKLCKITNTCYMRSCNYDLIHPNIKVEDMDICYNCQHWIGSGDWGLSCAKNYYKCSSNGFDKSCEQFERKLKGE